MTSQKYTRGLVALALAALATLYACSLLQPVPDLSNQISGDCDTLSITYTQRVRPIFEQNCYACHSISFNYAGVTLDNYDGIRARLDDGRLLCAINHRQGCRPMPFNQPKIDPCSIRIIEKWAAAGAPNN